jgi:hypothetical protein
MALILALGRRNFKVRNISAVAQLLDKALPNQKHAALPKSAHLCMRPFPIEEVSRLLERT